MPQDSLRSVVYRSFVTCDDPKGVAECNKTIRKSKKKGQKCKDTSASERSAKVELQNLSCFQVMEVSRGAEKLNEAIGSLSNRPSIDTTSDLLRGALHLQDSLVMLGKLQQASTFISNSISTTTNDKHKHKHNEKEKRPINDLNSLKDDFDKPRISASRDCYDELREVIRESFARQNLLPKLEERERQRERDVDLACSSSSSSLMYSNSSGCEEMMMKGAKSNLIAKLMGLEEAPANNAILKERIAYRRSPLLDIDLPRPKKPQFMAQKVVRERRTLEEIIEIMQFKGILERNGSNDCKLYSNASFLRKNGDGSNDCKFYSNASFLRKNGGLCDDRSDSPPIVIMRPLSGRDRKPHDHHWINGGEHVKSRKMERKVRDEFHSKPQLKKLSSAERPSKHKQLDEGKDLGNVRVRPVKKAPLDSQDRVSTTRMNQSKPQMQKKVGVVEKSEKKSKVAPNARKVADTKDAKPQRAKLTTLKHSTTVRENNAPKTQIARGRKVAEVGTGADKRMKPMSHNPTLPKKNPRSKPLSDLVENRQSDGNIEIIIDDSLVKSREAEQTTEEVAKAYYMSDNSRNAASSASDASGLITNDECNHTEDDSCIQSFDSDEIKGSKSITNTRFILLSSVSFVNHIEEFFDTRAHDSMVFQTACSPDNDRVLRDTLLLDCAKEILERKSMHCRSTRNQWSQHLLRRQKYHLSMEELVEEISDSIEDLQKYSRSCGDVVLEDSIHPMLERDLWQNEEVTGAWDSGWRKGYAMETVDEVMHDVEELVLSEIVADVIVGIMQ